MAMVITLSQQCGSLHRRYHRPGGTSTMTCGNIVKEDQDSTTAEKQKRQYSLCVLPVVRSLFAPVAA